MSAREEIQRACDEDARFARIWLEVQKGVARNMTFDSDTTTTTTITTTGEIEADNDASQSIVSSPSTSIAPLFPSELSDSDVKRLIDQYYYGSAKLLHKPDYPFYTEGIIVSSNGERGIEVFSRRVGKVEVKGNKKSGDELAYWLEEENGRRGVKCWSNKSNLGNFRPTVKFMKNNGFSITSFGLLGFSRSEDEKDWIVWNDFCGLMKVRIGSSRISKRKHSITNPNMEIVKITGDYVTKNQLQISNIVYHTDTSHQETGFPNQVVYVNDLQFDSSNDKIYKFWSASLEIHCFINDKQFVSEVDTSQKYVSFIVPHFPNPHVLEWRGLILATSEYVKGNEMLNMFKKFAKKNNEKLFPIDNNANVATASSSVSCDITIIKSE